MGKCELCEDICTDAAIAPCCGTSFCDECLREELLESEDHQCPSCKEINVSPDRIVANKSMRLAVENFKNDTGYTKVRRRRSNSTSGDPSLSLSSSSVSAPPPPDITEAQPPQPPAEASPPPPGLEEAPAEAEDEHHKTDIHPDSHRYSRDGYRPRPYHSRHYDRPYRGGYRGDRPPYRRHQQDYPPPRCLLIVNEIHKIATIIANKSVV